jgi:hypothetical protein
MELTLPSSLRPASWGAWPWLLGGSFLLLVMVTWFVCGQAGQKKRVFGALADSLLITPSRQHLGKLLQHKKKEFSFAIKN